MRKLTLHSLVIVCLLVSFVGVVEADWNEVQCEICGKYIWHKYLWQWTEDTIFFDDMMPYEYNSGYRGDEEATEIYYPLILICEECQEKYSSLFKKTIDELLAKLQEENKVQRIQYNKERARKRKVEMQNQIKALQENLKQVEDAE